MTPLPHAHTSCIMLKSYTSPLNPVINPNTAIEENEKSMAFLVVFSFFFKSLTWVPALLDDMNKRVADFDQQSEAYGTIFKETTNRQYCPNLISQCPNGKFFDVQKMSQGIQTVTFPLVIAGVKWGV